MRLLRQGSLGRSTQIKTRGVKIKIPKVSPSHQVPKLVKKFAQGIQPLNVSVKTDSVALTSGAKIPPININKKKSLSLARRFGKFANRLSKKAATYNSL